MAVSTGNDAGDGVSNARSASRALEVLKLLAAKSHPTPAATIARECGLPKSSTYHLLNVMHSQDFVSYYPAERAWGLGVAAFELGSAYLRSKPLERLGWPVITTLSENVGETAHLGILHGNESLFLLKRTPTGSTHLVTEVGVRLPAHLTGVGRAMLMGLPPAQLRALYPVRQPLIRRTGRGPTLRIELERELNSSRVCGYAVDDSLVTPGITCIAAPVYSHDTRAVAAVSVAFKSAHHPPLEWPELGQQVLKAASDFSRALGSRSASPV